MMTEQMSQGLALADKIDPADYAANTYTSTGVDMGKGKRAMYEIQIGAITGAGTLDANLQSCALANFASGVHNITNSNITQITNASPNCRVTVEVRSDQVTQQNAGDIYVRLRVVTATNAVLFGATGWLGEGIQKPIANTTYGANLNTTLCPQRLVVNT